MHKTFNRIGKYWLTDIVKELVLKNYISMYEANFDKINKASYDYFHQFFDDLEKLCVKDLKNQIDTESFKYYYKSNVKDISGVVDNIAFNLLDFFNNTVNYYTIVGEVVDEFKKNRERFFIEKEILENYPTRNFHSTIV